MTERIPIAGSTLAEFYWRSSHTTRAVRGHDISVQRVLDPNEAKTVRKTLKLKEGMFSLKVGENGYGRVSRA
ncbi:hypothetical protein AX14_009027 [Amanita brunnescens Koide BX004]|nr:hypothetical protein AX14_009027 [Amanita brunnescens Koide BX004]